MVIPTLTDMFVVVSKADPMQWLTATGYAHPKTCPEARVFADKDTANDCAKASAGVVITCRQFAELLAVPAKRDRK